jgi:hypothetical protein
VTRGREIGSRHPHGRLAVAFAFAHRHWRSVVQVLTRWVISSGPTQG